MKLTLRDVRTAVNVPDAEHRGLTFADVSTDTRMLASGDLFVALANAASDGHRFLAQAVERGAAALVVSAECVAPSGVAVVRVPDTEIAYGQIARAWREKFNVPIIDVTGSVGKTTVKEMLAATLSPLGPVLKTQASQNNETGVPKTLLQLTEAHRAAVIEMGMRGAGQIAYLAGIACPTVGVITRIAENHIELLGSLDAIAAAKGELLEALPADGIAILNADDPYFERLRVRTSARIVTYGLETQGADFHAEDVTRTDGGWLFTVQGAPVRLASASRHDVANALAAVAVAVSVGVPVRAAAKSLSAYAPAPMRMEIVRTAWGGIILNDAYNAAPASVRSALATLAQQPATRRIAFLGDMKELGAHSAQAHHTLGDVIHELGGLDALFTVGELAGLIPGATDAFADSDTAASAARLMDWHAGDVVLVKGSRAMRMESIAAALAEWGTNAH